MTTPLTSVTGDAGINGVGLLFNTELQSILRPLKDSDFGIDAEVELVLGGSPSGRVLRLQIKAGPSHFSDAKRTPAKDGWVFRSSDLRLREYWLSHGVPVLLVLYNIATRTAYWQHITNEAAVVTGKGFKVEVPAAQRVDASSYRTLARLARPAPPDGLTELLRALPARCGSWLLVCDETDPGFARRLAAALVDGREVPAETVVALTSEWDGEQQQAAWLAAGEYAIAYGAATAGAECFLAAERAADSQPGSGRLRAFAGAMLSGPDPDRARTLLEGCRSVADSRLLAAVGLAVLDHGVNQGPVPVPPEVLDDPDGAVAEPTVQRFLADQLMRVGDWDGAIAHHEQALVRASNAPDQQIALADALLRRAPNTATLAGADYRRTAGLAETARAELRRWRGDSTMAAHLLMQVKIMVSDEASALRVAVAQPEGEATPDEAASARLVLGAARLAYGRGDIEGGDTFAAVVDASGDPVWRANLAAHRANAVDAPVADRLAAWRAVLAADDDPGRRIAACFQLAGLGCWPLPALDEMAASGMLAAGIHDVLHASALAATGEHAAALALLRSLRSTSPPAAEQYAQQLASQGRVDDAVRACTDASTRFGYTGLELLALDILIRAGRTDGFLAKAIGLLGRADLPYRLRHAIRAKSIDEYGRRHDWVHCERLAQDGLREIMHLRTDLDAGRADALTAPDSAAADLAELSRQYSWMLVIDQFNQGHYQRAQQTLQELDPDPQTPIEVTTWFDLHQLQDWTPDRADVALRLAQRPGQPTMLVRRILFTVLQALPASEDPAFQAVQARLRQAWQEHADQHEPPAPPISPEQYVALAQASTARTAPVFQAVWQAAAPVGAISAVAGRPYLLGLAQQVNEFLPAVDADREIHRQEVAAAAAALGGPVVVETTAVFVAAAVLEQWSAIAAEFSDVMITAPAVYDVLLSHVHARALGQSAVTISLDSSDDAPRVEPVSEHIRQRILALCQAVGDAIQECRTISIPAPANVDDSDLAGAPGPWWTAVAAAADGSVPLYCDDVVVRARARARGVGAFGTLALLDALAGAGRREAPHTAQSVVRLFEHGVVDLPDAAALAMTAANGQTVLMTLARLATWTSLEDQGLATVITLANHPSVRSDLTRLAGLTYACASGWAAAFGPPDVVITKLLTVILAYSVGVTVEGARTVIPAAQMIAAAYEADFVPHLRTLLVGVLTDGTDQFRMTTEAATRMVQEALHDYD